MKASFHFSVIISRVSLDHRVCGRIKWIQLSQKLLRWTEDSSSKTPATAQVHRDGVWWRTRRSEAKLYHVVKFILKAERPRACSILLSTLQRPPRHCSVRAPSVQSTNWLGARPPPPFGTETMEFQYKSVTPQWHQSVWQSHSSEQHSNVAVQRGRHRGHCWGTPSY